MSRAAVIGSPVSHSLSPAMFNAAFAHHRLSWTYEAVEVQQGDLPDFLRDVREQGFGAFSVTMPLKSVLVPYLSDLDDTSRVLGAVNSVVVGDDTLTGYNTDGDGCCDAIESVASADFGDAECLVFGAGGTARSVVLAMLRRGARVRVLNRSPERAHGLVEVMKEIDSTYDVSMVEHGRASEFIARASILVNTTPVGMGHDVGASIADLSAVSEGAVVLDAVYQPLVTSFLAAAQSHGARAVDGLWMLAHQAVRQYAIWCGLTVSASLMRDAAEQELERRRK